MTSFFSLPLSYWWLIALSLYPFPANKNLFFPYPFTTENIFLCPIPTYEKLFFPYPLLLVKTCFSPICTPSRLTKSYSFLTPSLLKTFCSTLALSILMQTCISLPLLYWWKIVLHLPHPYLRLLPCSIVSRSLWCREQLQTVLAASPLNQAQDPVKRRNKIGIKETSSITPVLLLNFQMRNILLNFQMRNILTLSTASIFWVIWNMALSSCWTQTLPSSPRNVIYTVTFSL